MSSPDEARWRYGLWAVLGGSAAILVVCAVAILAYDTARDVGAAVGPAVEAIAALTGAYFGVQAGSAGKEAADASRDEAQIQALQFAAIADPDRALAVMHIGPTPPPDDDGGGPGPGGDASVAGGGTEVHDWTLVDEPQAGKRDVAAPPHSPGATREAGA